jgi:intracellular multiplication protein IcmC
MSTCTGSIIVCGIVSQANILNNLANSLGPVQKLITGTSYLIGCAFFLKSIYSLKIYGESRTMMSANSNIKEPLSYMFAGMMLIYFPSALSIIMESSFGYQNPLQYSPVNSNSAIIGGLFGSGSPVGRPLSMFIQVIGLVAFIRGWVLVARSASQGQPPGGTGKGLMHVFGGVCAINIIGTMEVINNTLYG